MNPEIISEESMSIYDLSKELKKIKKRDEELNIRTKKLEDYINTFVVLKQKESDDLEKELVGLEVPRLKEQHIKKFVELLPETVNDLKLILTPYPVTVSKENLKKIIDVVKKYVPEEK